jgi:hypothetical protein
LNLHAANDVQVADDVNARIGGEARVESVVALLLNQQHVRRTHLLLHRAARLLSADQDEGHLYPPFHPLTLGILTAVIPVAFTQVLDGGKLAPDLPLQPLLLPHDIQSQLVGLLERPQFLEQQFLFLTAHLDLSSGLLLLRAAVGEQSVAVALLADEFVSAALEQAEGDEDVERVVDPSLDVQFSFLLDRGESTWESSYWSSCSYLISRRATYLYVVFR